MADAWDAEDFDVDSGFQGGQAPVSDKWAGEDEDDVKDSWEDEDEGEKKETTEGDSSAAKAYQRPKKKLEKRIAEKQAERLKQEEEERKKLLSPEEQYAEKMKQRKLQEDSDLQLAKEAFGATDATGIDAMNPDSTDTFVEFKDALRNKIVRFEKSEHYVPFLDKLFTDLVLSLEPEDVKKLGTSISTIYQAKQKEAKEAQKKKSKKNKISLKTEREGDFGDFGGSGGRGNYDEFDEDYI